MGYGNPQRTLFYRLPLETFVPQEHPLRAQLGQWQAEIADERVHGTAHKHPTDRFAREQTALAATSVQPGFRLPASRPRRIGDDYLVSFETNRSSVPFTLIGQTIEVIRWSGCLHLTHRGPVVTEHEELLGKYLVRILPEYGPGAIARTARRVQSSLVADRAGRRACPEVEIRDCEIYGMLSATAVSA
jgi:hypothetical protein